MDNEDVDYKVTDSQLESIADKIREKTDSSDPLVFPSGFISGIQNIKNSDGSGA